jgi:hypothetical protein
MANYWDTFKPGLLAGEDYWEDFTPEAPTETGVVGEITKQRYQPWEKGYHNIAGLVDDSGQYDAWYDPDPPPVTSAPEGHLPEGFENWKNRIALETGTTTTTGGPHLPEGGAGEAIDGSYGGKELDIEAIKSFVGNLDLSKVALSLASGQPLMIGMALFGNKIDGILQSIFDSFKQDTDQGIQSVPEANSRSMAESFSEGQALEE